MLLSPVTTPGILRNEAVGTARLGLPSGIVQYSFEGFWVWRLPGHQVGNAGTLKAPLPPCVLMPSTICRSRSTVGCRMAPTSEPPIIVQRKGLYSVLIAPGSWGLLWKSFLGSRFSGWFLFQYYLFALLKFPFENSGFHARSKSSKGAAPLKCCVNTPGHKSKPRR